MRIVKYDKEWKRISSASVYGSNTYVPFDGGSLRMAEDKDYLYIHTCHTMYQRGDGVHHQANMSFVLKKNTMEITQEQTSVSNILSGYVSHSFNQFVVVDDGFIYRLDHGDAYPRALVVTKGNKGDIQGCINLRLFDMVGAIGQNRTGASVGGFKLAGNRLITAANSKTQEYGEDADDTRNIIVFSTDTDLKESKKRWLTNYTKEDSITVGTPQLLKIAEDRLCVMWEEEDEEATLMTKIEVIDNHGEKVSDTYTIPASLSDCAPIITSDGNIVWYVAKESAPVFYTLSFERLSEYHMESRIAIGKSTIQMQPKVEFKGETTFSKCFSNKLQTPEILIQYKGYFLKKNEDYTLIYEKAHVPGKASVTIQGLGMFKGKVTKKYTIILNIPKVTGVTIKKKGENLIHAKWKKVSKADGYEIQTADNAKFTKGKKSVLVEKSEAQRYVTYGAHNCYVRVRAYRYKLKEEYEGVIRWSSSSLAYGKWSAVRKVKMY